MRKYQIVESKAAVGIINARFGAAARCVASNALSTVSAGSATAAIAGNIDADFAAATDCAAKTHIDIHSALRFAAGASATAPAAYATAAVSANCRSACSSVALDEIGSRAVNQA